MPQSMSALSGLRSSGGGIRLDFFFSSQYISNLWLGRFPGCWLWAEYITIPSGSWSSNPLEFFKIYFFGLKIVIFEFFLMVHGYLIIIFAIFFAQHISKLPELKPIGILKGDFLS